MAAVEIDATIRATRSHVRVIGLLWDTTEEGKRGFLECILEFFLELRKLLDVLNRGIGARVVRGLLTWSSLRRRTQP